MVRSDSKFAGWVGGNKNLGKRLNSKLQTTLQGLNKDEILTKYIFGSGVQNNFFKLNNIFVRGAWVLQDDLTSFNVRKRTLNVVNIFGPRPQICLLGAMLCVRRGHMRRGVVGSVWPWAPSSLLTWWNFGQVRPFHPSLQTSQICWCQYFWTATSNMFVRGDVVLAQGSKEARRRRLDVA